MRRLLGPLALGTALVGCATTSATRPHEQAVPLPPIAAQAHESLRPEALHPPNAAPVVPAKVSDEDRARARLVEALRRHIGKMKRHGDCVAFIRSAFTETHEDLPGAGELGDNGVTALYRAALARGRAFVGAAPMPGDIAFFRETYDRNRDGELNDGLTHVALVEAIEPDGTVSLLHRGSHGAARIHMNLDRPQEQRDPKTRKVLNEILRKDGPETAPRLTGELFFAFARFVGHPPATGPQYSDASSFATQILAAK